MSKLFDITHPANGYNAQITLTSDLQADKYKVTYTCSSIGTNSFIMLYGINTLGEYTSYMLPVQFEGDIALDVQLDSDTTVLEICFAGNAYISDFVMQTNDNAYIEYVKSESKYWDRIKEITNSTGKLKAEAMEGIINMTVNAFANESGTITQENGVMTFLNGTTAEDSTQAVQIVGGAIRIASAKDSNGDWIWSTALTGAGINADTITAGTLRAIELSGVKMVASNFTAGNIIGAAMSGGSATFGDTEDGTYMEITRDGNINGYAKGKRTVTIRKSNEGSIYLSEDADNYDALSVEISPRMGMYNSDNYGAGITAYGGGLQVEGGGCQIVMNDGNIDIYPQNESCSINLHGNVHVSGYLKAFGGVE